MKEVIIYSFVVKEGRWMSVSVTGQQSLSQDTEHFFGMGMLEVVLKYLNHFYV